MPCIRCSVGEHGERLHGRVIDVGMIKRVGLRVAGLSGSDGETDKTFAHQLQGKVPILFAQPHRRLRLIVNRDDGRR